MRKRSGEEGGGSDGDPGGVGCWSGGGGGGVPTGDMRGIPSGRQRSQKKSLLLVLASAKVRKPAHLQWALARHLSHWTELG